MVTFDRSAFVAKFREEADEHLAKLNEGIIELEERPDDAELLDELFRVAHTLKGASRMVGILDVSEISHRLEDMLAAMRAGRLKAGDDVTDAVFEALDAIVFLSDAAVRDEAVEFDVEGLCERLAQIAARGEEEEPRKKKPATGEGKTRKKTPPTEQPEVTPSGSQDAKVTAQVAARPAEVKTGAATIRVKTDQVDKLLNLVGEMVIAQIKAEERLTEVKGLVDMAGKTCDVWHELRPGLAEIAQAAGPSGDELGTHVTVIDEATERMRQGVKTVAGAYADDTTRVSTVVRDLQEEGMQMRMLPVSTVFDGFPRAVRDMAKQYGKKIKLQVAGADTLLDKKVLEEINDPLIHIIRNSVDHGIESPDERKAAGKPVEGTIEMAAAHEGDHIVITVGDDGRGIDPANVRAAAIHRGVLAEAEAEALTDRQAMFLVFETGFSTSPILTEMSGRGVGLDVAKKFVVEKLKGSVNLESQVGAGTKVILTVPLTLAIIRALMVRTSDQTFALPTTSVEQTLAITVDDISKIQDRQAVRLRRRTIPIVHLDELLGLPQAPLREDGKMCVAVLGVSGQRIGLVVDELAGEQQIVIKSLGSHLKRVQNVAGATILGAGEIVVILHVPDLMTAARSVGAVKRKAAPAPEVARAAGRILIVEDSFTTRELERSIFEASGYEVEVALDGMDALAKLESASFDAVITDVQMPRMGGFELTAKLKSDERFASLPVVIVTSLEREEEKRKGIEVGADAYVTKSVFNQDSLLEIVERLTR